MSTPPFGSWPPIAPSGSAAVSSVFARTGAVVAATGDYAASQISNDSAVAGAHVSDALNTLAAASAVSSVFGRTGAVVAAANDYAASQISNDSAVVGTHVSDALNTLNAQQSAYAMLTAAQAIVSPTLVDITGMSWTLAAGARYRFALRGTYVMSLSATVGFGAAYSGTTSQFLLTGFVTAATSGANSIATVNTTALATAVTVSSGITLGDKPIDLFGTIVATSGGTFKLQAQVSTGTLTLQPGLVGQITRIG